ncbi:MAG TPA: phage tail protein [Desulfobacteraceae bacterium]|nr:phage tail protein [Desulfobacteraceae bacterium]
MTEPFIGEIAMIGGSYAPLHWALCQGQYESISQNAALYSLLGTQFGGNGTTNFALPDMRGRTPIHPNLSAGIQQGNFAGQEWVTVTEAELPQHTHSAYTNAGDADKPLIGIGPDAWPFGNNTGVNIYGSPTTMVGMSPVCMDPSTGSGLSHTNVQPSLAIKYMIAMQGTYPSRN